jgi:hypothetical protein
MYRQIIPGCSESMANGRCGIRIRFGRIMYAAGLQSYACPNCGATQTFNPSLRSLLCAFCGTQLVIRDTPKLGVTTDRLIIPFALSYEQAYQTVAAWLGSVSHMSQFAPASGVYVPYWHYVCRVSSNWTGRFGQVNYRLEFRGGMPHQVPYTIWFPMNGQHQGEHGAVVLASYGITPAEADQFLPYPLEYACPDIAEYHLGFITEEPAVTAEQAWAHGVVLIQRQEEWACAAMTQQLLSANVFVHDWRPRLYWVPMWIFGYWFNDKFWRIVVEGATGRVVGNKPGFWERMHERFL